MQNLMTTKNLSKILQSNVYFFTHVFDIHLPAQGCSVRKNIKENEYPYYYIIIVRLENPTVLHLASIKRKSYVLRAE